MAFLNEIKKTTGSYHDLPGDVDIVLFARTIGY